MQCFLSNKTHKRAETPRVIPIPTPRPPLSTHIEFEKFATFSEGVILDELDRHRKEVEVLSEMDEKKQKEIDDLYKKLLEKEREDEALKEQEDQKKEVLNKKKSPLLKPDIIAVGGRKPKTGALSKKSSSKPSRTLSQLHSQRWH